MKRLVIVALCLTATLVLHGPARAKIGVVTEAAAFKNGVQAYLYGYPLVLMDVTKQVGTQPNAPGPHGVINQFVNIWTFPDPNFTSLSAPMRTRSIPRPSSTWPKNPSSCTCRTPEAAIT